MKRKQKYYDVKNADLFTNVTFLLDAYRVYHPEEYGWIEKAIEEGRMGKRFKEDWKEIRKNLNKIARIPKKLEYLLRWANIQSGLKLIGLLATTLGMGVIMTSFLGIYFRHPFFSGLFSVMVDYAAIPLLLLFTIGFLGPIYMGRRISKARMAYFREREKYYREIDQRLKSYTQKMIDSLAEHYRREGIIGVESLSRPAKRSRLLTFLKGKEEEQNAKPELFLFNTDYKGIKVVRKPTFWRKHYIVTFREHKA